MKPGDMHGHVPQVLPHYRLRDRQLFFMISRRPSIELSSDDVLLYSGIDGRKTVAEPEQTHSGAGHRLLTWREAGIIALIPPVTPPTGPHLLVIEPHMDDAALSAGGRLILRRGQCRITILSVVRWSNFTSYLLLNRNFFDVSAITDLRLQESILASQASRCEALLPGLGRRPAAFVAGEVVARDCREVQRGPGSVCVPVPEPQGSVIA